MAFVSVGGHRGFQYPAPPLLNNFGFTNATALAATGNKLAFMGKVATPNYGTKSIRKVNFNWGSAITKAGGSALTLSLQGWSASGPPIQPDGTPVETVAIPNADIVNSTNYTTAALSADRSTAFGAKIAVVIEFDGSGRLGSDSITIRGPAVNGFDGGWLCPATSFFSASWANVGIMPTVFFENSDGSYSTLYGTFPMSAMTTLNFNSGSTPDENANYITLPWACKANGFWFSGGHNNSSADGTMILYDGTSAVSGASVVLDANQVRAVNSNSWQFHPFDSEITLAAQAYHLSWRPDTANNANVGHFDVPAAAAMDLWDGGQACYSASRTNAGGWSYLNTRRLMCGLNITAIDIGSAAGFKHHHGMNGGLSA